MKQTKFPDGWDAERVRRGLEHYEAQSDEEAVAEDLLSLLGEPLSGPFAITSQSP